MDKQTIQEKIALMGCGDHSCIWGGPRGMGTNGGCRCLRNADQTEIWRTMALIREMVKIILSQVVPEEGESHG